MDFWIMWAVVIFCMIALFKVKSKLLKLLFLAAILFLLWIYQGEIFSLVQYVKSNGPKLMDLQSLKDWSNQGLTWLRDFVQQIF